MGNKDVVSKSLLKHIALDMAVYLFNLEVSEAELLDTEFQRVEDRRADLLLHVKAPKDYLLHIEVQNDNHLQMPLRMLRYRVDIALAYPDKLIYQYVIYIGSQTLRMHSIIDEENLSYRYQLLDMRSIDCQTFLQHNTPDALVLAILCDFKGQDARYVVRQILQRLKALLKDNESGFREYWTMLEILSSNRNLQNILREETDMLSATKISDLPSYQGGWQEGHQEGHQEGLHQGLADMLLQQLNTKFKSTPAFVQEKIHQASNEKLMQWAANILTAERIEDIFTS